jgi:hypothetical protein
MVVSRLPEVICSNEISIGAVMKPDLPGIADQTPKNAHNESRRTSQNSKRI